MLAKRIEEYDRKLFDKGVRMGRAEVIAEYILRTCDYIASNLLNEGFEPPFVSKVTGLPIERITKLAENNPSNNL